MKKKDKNYFAKNQNYVAINLHKKRLFIVWIRKIIFFTKISLFIFSCLFLFTDIFKEQKAYLKNISYEILYKLGFKIKEVQVSGRKNVKIDDIVSKIDSTNILLLDLEKIKNEINTNKWIDKVIIYRKLPDILHINIFEKEPIAIYQYKKQLYLVDKNGDIISDKVKNFTNLIHAVGYNANIHISNLIALLDEYKDVKQNILYVTRHGDRRWDLILKENITIKLPEENIKEAIEYIDARNSTRYYIKYKQNQN